ncbi:MAG: oligosaccharide flippase family protein, partial [Deltaproteobacteria bacterium]|nr:oligosaccharide flippase family protein [Deltaproteobacteria bacterium]
MKIIRNFSFLTLSQIGEKIFNFLLVIVLARYLGVEEYGVYALAISFVGMFGNLFDGGLNFLLTREIASYGRNDALFFRQTLLLKVIVGTAVFAGLIVAAIGMQYEARVVYSIILFAAATLIVSFSNTFRAVFMGHERMEFEGGIAVFYRFFVFVGVFFLLT